MAIVTLSLLALTVGPPAPVQLALLGTIPWLGWHAARHPGIGRLVGFVAVAWSAIVGIAVGWNLTASAISGELAKPVTAEGTVDGHGLLLSVLAIVAVVVSQVLAGVSTLYAATDEVLRGTNRAFAESPITRQTALAAAVGLQSLRPTHWMANAVAVFRWWLIILAVVGLGVAINFLSA